MVQSRLRRLVNKTQFAPHQYAVGVDTFPRLNLDHVSRDLRLVELGTERGAAEEPAQTEQGFDEIEEHIVGYIRNKYAEARSTFEEQRQTYNQRLSKLSLHAAVGDIEDAAKSASANIEAETSKAADVANELRAEIGAAEAEWQAFRATHDLRRPARYPEGMGAGVLRWGILFAIILIEAAANGTFFAQGNDLGLVGGSSEALIIAILNVACGVVVGRMPARWILHRSLAWRVLGFVGLALWAGLAFGFNLMVGHYRDALEALSEEPAAQAFQAFAANPTELASFHSWMLFAVGIGFSLVALADGWSMDDPYPGYGSQDRRLKRTKNRYLAEREDHLSQVGELYDGAVEAVASTLNQVGKRRSESDQIGAGLESLRQSFQAHLNYLEEAANGLIQIYRDANRKARPPKTTPVSFRKRWKSDFPPGEIDGSAALSESAFQTLLKRAQDRKRLGERRLEKARTAAAMAFPPLSEGA